MKLSVFILLLLAAMLTAQEYIINLQDSIAQHDTTDPYVKKRTGRLDSTLKRLDHLMDSLTGRRQPEFDTLAYYNFLLEMKERNERWKRSRWKIGGSIALAVVVLAGMVWWGRKKYRG
ncbi:MAG TPA: hypothetical protein VNJ07_09730 [Chitinophagales bacterium]|nr:hypothetical protein [Chitinophagales bacterium]